MLSLLFFIETMSIHEFHVKRFCRTHVQCTIPRPDLVLRDTARGGLSVAAPRQRPVLQFGLSKAICGDFQFRLT